MDYGGEPCTNDEECAPNCDCIEELGICGSCIVDDIYDHYCHSDQDCREGEHCEERFCRGAPVDGKPCTMDWDCRHEWQVCDETRYWCPAGNPCDNDLQCNAGMDSWQLCRCVRDTMTCGDCLDEIRCRATEECPDGTVCREDFESACGPGSACWGDGTRNLFESWCTGTDWDVRGTPCPDAGGPDLGLPVPEFAPCDPRYRPPDGGPPDRGAASDRPTPSDRQGADRRLDQGLDAPGAMDRGLDGEAVSPDSAQTRLDAEPDLQRVDRATLPPDALSPEPDLLGGVDLSAPDAPPAKGDAEPDLSADLPAPPADLPVQDKGPGRTDTVTVDAAPAIPSEEAQGCQCGIGPARR